MNSGERGMNPVAMTIINPRKKYWPSRGSNQRPPVLKSCTLPPELWGLGVVVVFGVLLAVVVIVVIVFSAAVVLALVVAAASTEAGLIDAHVIKVILVLVVSGY